MPNHFTEIIPQLNAASQQPGQLFHTLKDVFSQRSEWAAALIPSYASHLASAEFDALSQEYPALAPLLNGYRSLAQSV